MLGVVEMKGVGVDVGDPGHDGSRGTRGDGGLWVGGGAGCRVRGGGDWGLGMVGSRR